MNGATASISRWSQFVKQLDGYAFVARSDGRILDANLTGWRFLESWRRERGGWELGAWLMARTASRDSGIPEDHELHIKLRGGRQYRLTATALPEADAETRETMYIVYADELLGRPGVPLSKLRAHYKLSQRESEVLSMLLNGYSNLQVAKALEMQPIEIKRLARRIRVKLGASSSENGLKLYEPSGTLTPV
ncbi:MAG: LuxR C-terminal-related transcriptional regulator [Planctomycetota bacterium]|nr:LuxR C-terminal-related transcriptional regulator [Planctomycetota bacterium]